MRLLLVLLIAFSFPAADAEVLSTFKKCSEFFLKGEPPVIPNVLNPNREDNRYKKICQKNGFRKEGSGYTFATLYDTEKRIPVFSAFRYTGRGDFKRPDVPWKIEPQLDPPVPEMTVPYYNQAIDEDYFENSFQVNRGHLFPSAFAADEFTAISTFTLTNIVPQYIQFNAGGWNQIERKTSDAMDENCIGDNGKLLAHVLIGAVPGNNELNERVNIPSHMWIAFCCYNSKKREWVSQAYWAPNKDENNTNINKISLDELQKNLSKNGQNVQLFKDNCPKKPHIRPLKRQVENQ